MSLGFDAISALPLATAQTAGDVQVVVSGNQLTIGIGNPAISADSITEIPDPNRLNLASPKLTSWSATERDILVLIVNILEPVAELDPNPNRPVVSILESVK